MTSLDSLTVQTCDGLPADPEERKEMILGLTADFLTRFESGLKPERLRFWKECGLNPPDAFEQLQITRALDQFILSQARILGAWLFYISPALLRLTQWHNEPDGAELMNRLGREIALGIRASRGEARFPIDDAAWYDFKRESVVELRALQSRLGAQFATRHRSPSGAEIRDAVEKEIRESPTAFSRLFWNLEAFLQFLALNEKLACLFVLGQIRPSKFFHEFAGWSTNRDPEKLRQMISRLSAAHQ